MGKPASNGGRRLVRMLATIAALATCLSACSGSGHGDVSATQAASRLQGWMQTLSRQASDHGAVATHWRVSTRDRSARGCAKGIRTYYLADFTLRSPRNRDDAFGNLLVDWLEVKGGWTGDFQGPDDPDGKGYPRLWFGQRKGDDPTGTKLSVTYQWNGKGFHFLVSAHTACLPAH